MTITHRLADTTDRIKKTSKDSILTGCPPRLMGVSKGQGAQKILEAINLGVKLFGENRVQEASEKWPEIRKNHPDIELHLIGPLQSNKVRQALELFDVIQTVDRPKLALAIASELESWRNGVVKKGQKPLPHHPITPSPHFYIQINTGEELQKAGIFPKEADDFIRYCRDELKLPIVGLMCIPPVDDVPAPHFALLRDIALRNGLKELSMGMSDDFETAIRMGSSCIRVGRALFGDRTS